MRTFYRNWITYDMAYGKRVCIPHHKKHCGCYHGRNNLCCEMLELFCKHAICRCKEASKPRYH